jgi:hypothetical protein
MCAGRPTCAPHPERHDRSEPSTCPCRSCDATAPACHGGQRECAPGGPSVCHIRRVAIAASPACPRAALAKRTISPASHGRRRDVRRTAHVFATSGASRSQRAKHVPVPLARRNPLPPAAAGSGDVRCTAHVCAASGASRSPRAEHVPMPLARRDPPRLSRPAAGCAPGGPSVCRTLRVAIAASRAHLRAARATRPPPPATAGGVDACRAAPVCAASGALRSPRAQHVPVPLVRRNRLPQPAEGNVHRAAHARAESAASRTKRAEHVPVPLARRDATAPACHGRRRDARRTAYVCSGSGGLQSQRAEHAPVPLVRRDPHPHLRLPRPAEGNVQRAAHASAASGASRSPRAEHIFVPLARRGPPRPATAGGGMLAGLPRACRIRRIAIAASRARLRAARPTRPPPPSTAGGGMCAGRPTRVPHRARSRSPRAELVPMPLVRCDRPRLPRPAAWMCAWRPPCVPHPARRDCSEPSTHSCCSCDAAAPAYHGRRRTFTGWPTVCATSSGSRSQRAEHVPAPLVRCPDGNPWPAADAAGRRPTRARPGPAVFSYGSRSRPAATSRPHHES